MKGQHCTTNRTPASRKGRQPSTSSRRLARKDESTSTVTAPLVASMKGPHSAITSAQVQHALRILGDRRGSSLHAVRRCLSSILPRKDLPSNFQIIKAVRRRKTGPDPPIHPKPPTPPKPTPVMPTMNYPEEKPRFKLDFQTMVDKTRRESGRFSGSKDKKKRKTARGRRKTAAKGKRGRTRVKKRKGKNGGGRRRKKGRSRRRKCSRGRTKRSKGGKRGAPRRHRRRKRGGKKSKRR